MNNDTIKKVKKIIADRSGHEPHEILEASYFEDDLNIGEMDLMDILVELEDAFQIELLAEKDNLETVQDLLDVMSEQLE
jgi:acyl carrier protein